jgi:hypothetical protein
MEESKRPAPSPIMIVYVGNRHEEFARQFAQFGLVTPPLSKINPPTSGKQNRTDQTHRNQ